MALAAPASAYSRIAQLAADRRVHRAFRWLHLQEQQILRWQAELVQVLNAQGYIPTPRKVAWCLALDVGQAADPSAITVLERAEEIAELRNWALQRAVWASPGESKGHTAQQ